jgi:hypothetical protein
MMRVFEHARSRKVGSSAARLGSILQSPGVPNSLVVGKNAGNFADQAAFCKNSSRKHLQIQPDTRDSLRKVAGNYFARAGKQFGLLDRNRHLAQNRSALPTYLISSKRIYIVDKTIINRHVCEIITEHRLDAGRGRHEGAQGQLTGPGTLALYGDV